MAHTSSPSGVSALEDHVGFWLRFVSNHVSAEFRRLVEQNGVSVSDWVALRQLFGQDGASAADLMGALGMTKGAVSKIVTRLEARGLAARSPAALDKRAQLIGLTAAGRALVPRLAALADQNDARFFGTLDAQQRATLVALMKQVVHTHQFQQIPTE